MTADGMYATSNEKIGENIPEGVTPEYEGQYDVYATFLYRIDNNGNLTKLDKYESMPGETDDQNRKELCFQQLYEQRPFHRQRLCYR